MKRYIPLFESSLEEAKKDGETWKTKSGYHAGKYKGKIQYFNKEAGAKEYASSGTGAKKEEPKSNKSKSDYDTELVKDRPNNQLWKVKKGKDSYSVNKTEHGWRIAKKGENSPAVLGSKFANSPEEAIDIYEANKEEQKMFNKLPKEEQKVYATNKHVDTLTKRIKPENYFTDEQERHFLNYIKDKDSNELTPESKKKIEDLESGVKKHVDTLIKKNKSLQTVEKMAKKGYSHERIRGELLKNDPKTYDEMYKLMGEHFSDKGAGWFSGLGNFIKYVKGEGVD